MIDVKRPRLLDDDLKEAATLRAMSLALNLQTPGVSTATLVLGPDDPEPAMHAWIECYNLNGSVGVYRVTTKTTDYAKQTTLTLRHGIDALADAVLPAQEEYNGPPAALLTRLLDAQKTLVQGVKPWTLGTCEATDSIRVDINYTRLSELLSSIEELLEDYFFEYDQTTFPWTLNVRAKPAAADSEIRMNRAVTTISRTLNDADMCNQLILSINSESTSNGVTTTNTLVKTYNNLASQQRHRAVIQKTADIDTKDDLTAATVTTPEADAWAARFLRDHADPTVQLQITKRALKHATGDDWDETRLAHICRVPLPDYGATYNERAVAVNYPDALGQPDTVVISFANQLPRFSSSIASLKRESNKQARAGRAAGRSAAKAKEVQTWSQVVRYHDLALDGTGVKTLYESGIDMTPSGGVKIWNLEEGIQALYAGIEVNRHAITLKVSNGQVATQLAVECGNVHVTGTEGAANLVVDGYITATALDTRLANVDKLFTTAGYANSLYAGSMSVNTTLTAGTVQADNFIFRDTGTSGGGDTIHARPVQLFASGYLSDISALAIGSASTMDLRHYHDIDIEEVTSGENAGKMKVTLGSAVSTSDTTDHIAFFKIADTTTCQNLVSAAEISGWQQAGNAVYAALPSPQTGSHLMLMPYPSSEKGTLSYLSYGVACNNDYAYIYDANDNVVARVANPKPTGAITAVSLRPNASVVYDETEKEYTVPLRVTGSNVSNSPWDSGSVIVSGSDAYNHGHRVGVADAAGISAVDLNGPASSAYSDGTDKGTLTADKYYQVEVTPTSGSKQYIKFKTPAAPSSTGTITGVVQRQTATFDATEKEIYVYPTVNGTNISNAPYQAAALPVTASVTIDEGSWTDSATKKAITAKLNGTTAATLTVSAPSVDVSFANADSTSVSSYYTTWHAGHQYRVRLTRGGTTVWNRYIKVTT